MDSIFNQTFSDFEIILLDDASTDDSEIILEKYRHHHKVKGIWYNNKNSGRPITQWIKGIGLADTDWIWIAESDDYCETDFLENLIHAFNNANVVLAYNELTFVNGAGNILLAPNTNNQKIFRGADFLRKKLLANCFLANSGMLVFRKSAIKFDLQILDSYTYSPDYHFWCEIVLKGQVFASGKASAFFVKHPNEFTANKVGSTLDIAEHLKLLNYLLETGVLIPSDLTAVMESKLISKACVQRGMTDELIQEQFGPWYDFQKIWDIPVNYFLVNGKALLHKAKHRWRNRGASFI